MEDASCELLALWYEGDAQALGRLVELHRPWLHRYASFRLGNPLRLLADSEDVVQDVMLRLLRYGPSFAPQSTAQFRALIGRMVVHQLANLDDHDRALRRDRGRRQALDQRVISHIGAASDGRPDRCLERAEAEATLRLALELVGPADREVLELRDWDQLGFAEIGAALGIESKAADKRYRRAVLRLGQMIERLRRGQLEELEREVEPFVTSDA